jgi:hypothetical protein
MIREKRLSPRRASSRLPLSPRQTRVRLKPLLFLRPLPLQRRHIKSARLARFCTHYEYPFFDARPEGFRSSVRLRRRSSCPTARLRRKSTVCGLNGLRPASLGPLHLNPRPPVRGSCSYASLRRAQTSTHVSVLETKIAPRTHFSLQNGIQKILRREGENKGQWPNRNGDGHSTKQETLITYYNEHQSHHHQW